MRLAIELQLMRVDEHWKPRSRPSVGWLNLGDPDSTATKLTPGAGAVGTENMVVHLEGATRIDKYWATFRASLIIEGMGFPGPRPGIVYLGESDFPTGAVHFARASLDSSAMFGGWHTLLVRLV